MKYNKQCSKCQSIQLYSNSGNYNRAIKNNTLCKKCNGKNVSEETRKKLSESALGKPKAKEATTKMRNSLINLWKNKSKEELENWKDIVSKTTSERWKKEEYRAQISNSVKLNWEALDDNQRSSRFLKQQQGGAGTCKYTTINDYIVHGKCEERYIRSLYASNSDLPFKTQRIGVRTLFGMTFPDFEYDTHFVEIKSTYTFNKMIEEREKRENCQLGKLMWIMKNIKDVKILVETSINNFEDKTELAILPFLKYDPIV
jgi:hypothetical protein